MMQIEGYLTKEESLRLECLRLAVAAGQPDLREEFRVFVSSPASADELATAVRNAIQKISDERSTSVGEQC